MLLLGDKAEVTGKVVNLHNIPPSTQPQAFITLESTAMLD